MTNQSMQQDAIFYQWFKERLIIERLYTQHKPTVTD